MTICKHILTALAVALCLFTATSCASTSGGSYTGDDAFKASDVRTCEFNDAAAQYARGCAIDISHVAEGYVSAYAESDSALKFQVVCNGESYNYNMPNDGSICVFPLNMGDGSYTFRVMQNIGGSQYIPLFTTGAWASMDSEFEPFLHPSIYCDFDENSPCVQQARTQAQGRKTQAEAVNAIYEWVVASVRYDRNKAATLQNGSGYIPNPNETFETRRGICFDYASLTAAMLRSIGVPCKIVTGYVSPDNIYHAWNMVYLNSEWVTVHFTVSPDEWARVDTTFASAGASNFIGDGTNYTDRFTY